MGKGELTRQNILQHAVRLASAMGLDGLTIGKLASDLKLSKSGLFAHFQSKEALQIQVLSEAGVQFTEVVIRPTVHQKAGEPRVRALFENWLRWGYSQQAHPGGCVFLAASIEMDDQPGPVRDHLVSLQREWVRTMERIVKSAVDAGFFGPGTDPAQVAQEIYSIFLGLSFYARLLGDRESERRARESFESLLKRFGRQEKRG